MNKLAKWFLFLFGGAVILVVGTISMLEKVPPATIGVRQALWGGGGVEELDYDMGFHLGITGYHKWHFLDRRTHFLTFAELGTSSRVGQLKPPLVIRTKDNNTANFDVTVTYRIMPGKGFELVQKGLKEIYKERVTKTVESVMREELAQLSSEDIYSTEMRLDVAKRSLPKLAKELESFFVQPDQVLIRAVRFTSAYERKLQEKQLTYQQRLLATAQERVERQLAITQTKEAEIEAAEKEMRGDWDKRLETLRAENEITIAIISAEMRVYDKTTRAAASADYETLIADGTLAVVKAEALRDELRNQALDTRGGRILRARDAAENLQFDPVTLNSHDPTVPSILDLNEMVEMLVGAEADATED
jgi:regulator of protease activity HflC (stomatin/prohibitin superfamily)